ncbi:GapS6a family protein [Entomomonas asaccharolytica]|uniref:Uncharacterized protein n=1 Tax=Entomomonas asaccharolytica TaxID=2785331 RepID=A0A974NDJ3_9GAMM|nr:hypothetical protein [Entomomonas asaccharolytica]QQP84780.1 hypothetical protein JHT90_10245 [Entomomonas asaccharolytica]
MDFITAAVLSGLVYDLFRSAGSYSVTKMKELLLNKYSIAEVDAERTSKLIEELDINEDMSAKAIEKKIEASVELMRTLRATKVSNKVGDIQQNHSGNGDNVITINNKN